MIISFKKNLILFLVLFSISFISLYFLFDKSVKDNEKSNISIDYYFDEQILNFLKKEEIKIREAIILVNRFGYSITENDWLFASDGLSYALKILAQNIDQYNFILNTISKDNQLKLSNESIEKLIINSKKKVDKSNYKVSIFFSFDDHSHVEKFFLSQGLIKEFFDKKIKYLVFKTIETNNKLLFSINEFLNDLKKNCEGYNKSDLRIDQNQLTEKFVRIYSELFYYENVIYEICNDLRLKKFIPIDYTFIENDVTFQNDLGIKMNELFLTYVEIKKTKLVNYILFIFMISLSLSLFLLMLINKLKKN